MSANPLLSAIGRSDVDIIVRQATVNPASVADTADTTTSATVTDVEIGDIVLAALPYDGQSQLLTCIPSAANTIDIPQYNASGGVVDLASGTWTFLIFKTSAHK